MKRIVVIMISLIVMAASLFMPCTTILVSADGSSEQDVHNSIATVTTSIKELEGVIEMTPTQQGVLTNIFDDFSSVFKSIGGIVAPINGAVNFLRMIGVMKDPTSTALINIQAQLNDVSNKLTNMDRKLNEIATQMTRMEATEEFHHRATQAVLMRQNWSTFRTEYMENGLNELMRQYEAKLTDQLINWFKSNSVSDEDGTSNPYSILVWYDCESKNGPCQLQNTLMNGFDSEHERSAEYNDNYTLYADEFDINNDRLISLSGTFFDDVDIDYDADSYRVLLKLYIFDKINEEFDDKGDTGIKAWNINRDMLDDNFLDEITESAVDIITFKLSNNVINESADFSSKILNQYNLYCQHLLTSTEGLDALLQTMYFTHAFEFEIKEDILNLVNIMNLQTGVYSAFVGNVIASAKSVSADQKAAFTKTMCDTLNSIAKLKKTAVTGQDRYSYITNTIVDYGNIHLETEASINWRTLMAYVVYQGYNSKSIDARVTDSSSKTQNVSLIIGDAPALLISYVVKGNGDTFNHNYMNKHLAINQQPNHNGTISSYHGEQYLSQDTDLLLATYSVIGNYFEGNPNIYLKSLPKKAEFGYVNNPHMVTGTLFDGASSNMDVNRPLLATAVYGENHGSWFVDEAALIYGPNNIGSRTTAFKRDTTYEDTFLTEYRTSMYEAIDYNVLISIPLKGNEALEDENSPLNNYYNYCDEVIENKDIDHVHNWDDGSIIRPASDEEPGIIKYTCLDENDSASFYTQLFTNDKIAELTFDLDGGSLPSLGYELSREFVVGSKILLPNAPEKQGYTFQYWSESKYPADSEYLVTGDRTFKAIWVENVEYQLDNKTEIEWYKNSNTAPYIKAIRIVDDKATLSHFKEVRVNGAFVDKSNYKVSSGSIILEFKTSFLSSLPTGSNRVEILFDDGKVEFVLNIREGSPKKDDRIYILPETGVE